MMKILDCGYYEKHENNIWRCVFDVEDVEEAYIQKAKEFDDFYDGPCFEIEILYNEAEHKVFNPADLVYIDFNGDALCFDYDLDMSQQEYVLECIKKEILV